MAIRKKDLPIIKKSAIHYRNNDDYFSHKGVARLGYLASALFQDTHKTEGKVVVYNVPINSIPQKLREQYKDILSEFDQNDVLIIVNEPAVQSDRSNRTATFTHALVANQQQATQLTRQARQDPTVVDAIIQNQFGGPITRWDGQPINIPARKVSILSNKDLGGDIVEDTEIDLPENYIFNQSNIIDALEQSEDTEEAIEQAPIIQTGATIDTSQVQDLQAQQLQAEQERLKRQEQISQSVQSSIDQANKVAQQNANKLTETPEAHLGNPSPIKGYPSVAGSGNTQPPSPPSSITGSNPPPPLNTNEIERAALSAIETANQFSAATLGSNQPPEQTNITLQRLIDDSIKEATQKVKNLRLNTQPKYFQSIYEKAVLESLEEKVSADPSLQRRFITSEREARTSRPIQTALTKELEDIALVGTGAAVNTYLQQQTRQGISTEKQQATESFPNISQAVPRNQSVPSPSFEFNTEPTNQSVDSMVDSVMRYIPVSRVAGRDRDNLKKTLHEELSGVLQNATENLTPLEKPATITEAIQSKVINSLQGKTDTEPTIIAANLARSLTYDTNQYIAATRQQKDLLFENMRSQKEAGLWADTDNVLTKHLVRRENIKKQIQELRSIESPKTQAIREKDVEQLQVELDSLDQKFLSTSTATIDSYKQSINSQSARDNTNTRFSTQSINMAEWQNILNQAAKGDAIPSYESASQKLQTTDSPVDRGITTYTLELAKEVQAGKLSVQGAETKLNEYLDSQRKIFEAFQNQSQEIKYTDRNFYSKAENLQKSIDEGANIIENTFQNANKAKLGSIRYANAGITTKQQEEDLLIEIIGWKEYDKLRLSSVIGKNNLEEIFKENSDINIIEQQLKAVGIRFSNSQELNKFINTVKEDKNFIAAIDIAAARSGTQPKIDVHDELTKILGDTTNRKTAARLQYLGIDEGEAAVDSQFYREISRNILELYKDNPAAQPGDVIQIYHDAYDKFVGKLDKQKIYQLSDDEIRDLALNLIKEQKVQKAFTAAQNAQYVIPYLNDMGDDLHERAIERLILTKSYTPQPQSGLKVTYDQIFRDAIREDYVSELTDIIISKQGLSRTEAKTYAQKAVLAALGGTTQIDDGNGYAIENLGVLANTPIKDFGYLHKLALEKMTPSERAKYLKEFPEYNAYEQRIKTLVEALRKQLELDGIKISSQEIEKLVKSLHTDKLQEEMAILENSNTTVPSIKLMTSDPLQSWKQFTKTNYLERKIQQKFLEQGDYITRWLPISKYDKKALILGQVFHPDKSSKALEAEVSRFLRVNNKPLTDLQLIMSGGIPTGYTLTEANTVSVYSSKAKLHNWIAETQAKHPTLTKYLIKWGKFLERDDVQIVRMLAHGNPLENGFGLLSNQLINNILIGTGKWKYFDDTKRVEHIGVRNFSFYIDRQKALFKQKLKRRFMQTIAGKALTATKNAIVNIGKKILSKLPAWMLKLGARAIPVIGQIYAFLDALTGGLLTRLLKLIAAVLVISLVWFILRLLSLPLKIFSWLQQIGSWSFNVGTKIQAAFSGFSFNVNLGFLNPTGWISGALTGIQNTLSMVISGYTTASSFFANLAAWTANFGAMGTAAAITISGSFIIVNLYHLFIAGSALKDAPPKIDAASISSVNPLFIQKVANPQLIPNEPLNPPEGKEISYTITVTAPPCSPTLSVTDTLPTNLQYVPGSIGYQPFAPPITGISTNDSTAPTLSWSVNTDGANAENCLPAEGGLDFRAANDEFTQNLLNQILSSSSQLRFFFLRNEVPNFVASGNEFNINGLGPIAISYAESHLGEELNGQGIGAPEPDGCFNLAGLRVSGLPTCPPNGSGRSSGFSRFNSYAESITVLSRTINNRLNDVQTKYSTGPNTTMTVEYLAALYIPTNDPRNCSQWEPGVSPGSDIGCTAGFNAQWKRTVTCTMVEKQLCTWPIETYLKYKNGAQSPGTNITELKATLTYKAIVTGGITEGCLTNAAVANMGTYTNRTRTTVTIGNAKCSDVPPAPSDSLAIINTLCSGIPGANGKPVVICPTVNRVNPPSTTSIPAEYQVWTLPQLQALWNVAHKVASNPNYANYATGIYTIEVTRSRCFQADGVQYCPPDSKIKGYNAGRGSGWQTLSNNPKLIMITDNVVGFTTNIPALEWLFAHEIGHSAQFGTIDGDIGDRNRNPAYTAYLPCYNNGKGEVVSSYGQWKPATERDPLLNYSENHADALSFYMTSGETAINGYSGGSNPNRTGDIKIDYPCTYSKLIGPIIDEGRDVSFFGGLEYEP